MGRFFHFRVWFSGGYIEIPGNVRLWGGKWRNPTPNQGILRQVSNLWAQEIRCIHHSPVGGFGPTFWNGEINSSKNTKAFSRQQTLLVVFHWIPSGEHSPIKFPICQAWSHYCPMAEMGSFPCHVSLRLSLFLPPGSTCHLKTHPPRLTLCSVGDCGFASGVHILGIPSVD